MKTKTIPLITLAFFSLSGQRASASIIIYATEVANNVVFSGSGTINLNGLNLETGNWRSAAGIMSSDGYAIFRMSPSGPDYPGGPYPLMHRYSGATTPEEPFTTINWFRQPDEHSGVMLGMHASELHISNEYISGSPIFPSMTYLNASFEALELVEGEFTWSWGSGENFDTLTVVVVPEPKSSTIVFGLVATLISLLKRRMPTSHHTQALSRSALQD